jgi:HipA-like protein
MRIYAEIDSGSLGDHVQARVGGSIDGEAIAILDQLRNQIHEGTKVYTFFDNLLPDNESIRARI